METERSCGRATSSHEPGIALNAQRTAKFQSHNAHDARGYRRDPSGYIASSLPVLVAAGGDKDDAKYRNMHMQGNQTAKLGAECEEGGPPQQPR